MLVIFVVILVIFIFVIFVGVCCFLYSLEIWSGVVGVMIGWLGYILFGMFMCGEWWEKDEFWEDIDKVGDVECIEDVDECWEWDIVWFWLEGGSNELLLFVIFCKNLVLCE